MCPLLPGPVVHGSESPSSKASPLVVVDACMPKGFNETLVSPADGKEYLVVPADDGADFDACDKQVRGCAESASYGRYKLPTTPFFWVLVLRVIIIFRLTTGEWLTHHLPNLGVVTLGLVNCLPELGLVTLRFAHHLPKTKPFNYSTRRTDILFRIPT